MIPDIFRKCRRADSKYAHQMLETKPVLKGNLENSFADDGVKIHLLSLKGLQCLLAALAPGCD